MPFAPRIRKDMLKALEDHIIPALQSQQIIQILAEPPFDFSAAECRVVRKRLLADRVQNPLQIIQQWEKEHLMSMNMPTFGFVYEGANYHKVGVTVSMNRRLKTADGNTPPGITQVRIPAPGILYFPPNTPKRDGSPPSPKELKEGCRTLSAKLMKDSVLVLLSESTLKSNNSTHNLEIRDAALSQMGLLYLDELRQGAAPGAQGLMLAFMGRLQRYLRKHQPRISNTAWVNQQEQIDPSLPPTQLRHQKLCYNVMAHVQTHLHTPLSLEGVAAHFGISGYYLNKIFTELHHTTVMRYVTLQRIEAAKEILRLTPERTSDTARLVGFASPASFCITFQKHTGLSPSEYRRQIKK
jgi:AraC-like DNA-binding protein